MSVMLNKNEVSWNSISSIDRLGNVFFYKDKCYRAVYNNRNQIKRVNRMFSTGLIGELVEKGMILPIQISDVYFENDTKYGMFLESPRVKNVLYPTEWSYSMLLDAALLMVEMEKVLLKYGYTFYDYHPYNIIFDENMRCYHVDLGSIVLADKSSMQNCIDAIVQKYYRPLYIWRKNKRSVTGFYVGDKIIDETEWNNFLWGAIGGQIVGRYIREKKCVSLDELGNKFMSLGEFVRKTEDGHWAWSSYQDGYIYEDGKIKENKRFQIISDYLLKYKVTSFTELAANQGAFSQYCLEREIIDYSLAIDYDEWAVDKLYQRLKTMNSERPKMSVGVVDILRPKSRDSGICEVRMKNHTVIAMALIHHLCLSQGRSFENVLDIVSRYAEKYMFVEFMPLGLYSRNKGGAPVIPKWYNIDDFRSAFEKRCVLKEEIKISNNRILFVGEIRREK